MKKFKSLLILISFVTLFFSNVANAESPDTGTLTGSVTSIITLNKEQVEPTKEMYEENIDEAVTEELPEELEIADEEGNETEIKEIQQLMDGINENGSEILFVDETNESKIETQLPDLNVKIDEFEVSTDENGNFQIPGIPTGTYNLYVTFEDSIITTQVVEIKNGENQFDIELNLSGKAFFEGSQIMSEKMMTSDEVGEASTTYYSTKPIGSTVGSGMGTMKIIAGNNIVGCNKAANSLSDSSKFPLNSSDCAVAIARGTSYAGNPTVFFYWKKNYVCYIESIQSALDKMGENSGSNVYCNGKKKSDGHYNCSWFRDHSERLHTH
ncbi:hypothetical protein ACWM35_11080 [Neobacillus sp. K501]